MQRRTFIRNGLMGATALAQFTPRTLLSCSFCKKPSAPYAGLKMGIASYSLRKFSLDDALIMTQKLGVKYITLKDIHLSLKSTQEEIQTARKKIAAAGILLMGGGVIYMENEADVLNAFKYAKSAGMPTIVASPDPPLLDLVNKMVKENDIRVAIHNHGPSDKRYPSPFDVMNAVQPYDPRLGLCIDVGHTVRIGVDPVDAIRKCGNRLHDFHIKDVTLAEPKGETIEVGRGVINLGAVLKALLEVKFQGHLALEYEIKPDDPLPGMIESFAYMKGILDAVG
jgi:sugar phosphate isomerase/epimerase